MTYKNISDVDLIITLKKKIELASSTNNQNDSVIKKIINGLYKECWKRSALDAIKS